MSHWVVLSKSCPKNGKYTTCAIQYYTICRIIIERIWLWWWYLSVLVIKVSDLPSNITGFSSFLWTSGVRLNLVLVKTEHLAPDLSSWAALTHLCWRLVWTHVPFSSSHAEFDTVSYAVRRISQVTLQWSLKNRTGLSELNIYGEYKPKVITIQSVKS